MRISDWSSDVCSSDLNCRTFGGACHGDRVCDGRTPIATLSHEAIIAKPPYQRDPGLRNAFDTPSGPGGRVGEAIARYRWRDHMEGVARIAAICCGVRQRRDNLVKLDHRSRPAMCDQERKRIRFRRTNMKEIGRAHV